MTVPKARNTPRGRAETLRVERVRHRFAGADGDTLRQVDLQVAPGQIAFILGPSGAGKSSLLRIVSGLLQPSGGGRIWLGEQNLTTMAAHARRVGHLFQEPALFPHLDAGGNVAFALRYQGVARRDRRPRAAAYLAEVGLAGKERRRIDELSGGERQRVALARTLAARPRALLLDEPLSALDADLRRDLGERLRGIIRASNIPTVWVTHDAAEAAAWGESVHMLRDGVLTSA